MTKKITPNFLRQFFVLIIFLQSFTILSQNVAITISVNWPNWSSENKIELLDPSNNIIFSIDNGYTGSGNAAYQNTVSTNPNVPVNNSSTNGYSVRIYDLYGDGWNSNGFATVNIDGIDILTVNNSNFSAIPGSGGEIVSNRIFFAVEQAPNLDDASFTYPNSSYSISDTDPTPTITGETGGTFTSTAGLVIDNSTGLIDVSASILGSYTVTYTTNEPDQNSAQQNITISFATSQYHDNSKKYIEYIPGTMPVIISAPHGGVLQSGRSFGGVFYPDNDNSLPDRSCGTNEQDDNTDVLIKEIQKKCFEQFGEYPYIIVSNLHRSKLDPNRNKSVATCNNSNAGVYFDAYHNFIDQASADITAKFGKGLYIDLHGQSHSVPRVEAGYNLYSSSYDENLDNSATNAVELSRVTIKNLIENNIQNLSFEDLIRGSQSFGGLLQTTGGSEYASLGHAGCNRTEGYRTVPSHISSGSSQGSCDDTNPGNFAYFAGDYYSNIRHGSGDPAHAHSVVQGGGNVNGGGGTIDGIMTEVNRRVRDMGNLLTSYDGRQDTRSSTIPFFARDYAQVLEKYIDLHYNNFSNFSYNSSSYDISDADPTPTITGISGGVFSSTSGLSINSTTGNIDLSNSSPGNYLVTYIAPNITNYYKKEINITITGVVLDNADFSYTIDTACQNNSDLTPTISGESGGTFSSTIGLSINSTTGVIDNSTSTAGSYTVTYTTTNPGSNSATDIVTIHENPTLSITNPTAVCAGETIDLTSNAITNGSSAGTLTYFSDANATASLEMPSSIATSGTYYIKLTNTNGCETVKAVNVTVNTNPTLTITNPTAVCAGATVDLTANTITAGSSAGTLAYFSDANATSTLANTKAIAASGTYYIKLTNTNGCETVQAVNVTVNTNPTLTITNPAAVCAGETVDLTANAITNGSSTGTLTYFSDANANATLANANAISTSGTYYIKLTNTNGCETVQAVNVTVNTNPTLTITNPAAVCAGETVDLTANEITTGSSTGTLTYFSDANATSTLANANAITTSGTYYIKLTNTNGCETVEAVNVTVNENPTLTITNPAAVCSGATVDLTANAITNGSSSGTLSYFSDANATSSLANANAIATSGTYYIKLSNTNGCETVEAVNVTVNENPTLVSITPSNNSLNVALDSNLVISFSENIVASSGNLTLKKVIDNSIVETILSSSTNITGNQVSINPTKDLELNTSYYLEISNSAFTSTNGCNFSGISNSTEWSFKTIKNQNNTFLATNGLWSLDANWSLGRKPITTDNVIIPSGRTANLNENNIDITNLNVSGIFNIQKNIALTVNENITNTGTFTVNSGASLIVNGNATGIFNYKRTLEANKWYLVGSPVSGQTIVDFINSNSSISRGSGSGDDQNIAFAPFNNNTSVSYEKWTYFKEGQIDGENADDTTEIITPGTGYTIRLSSTTDIIFSGTLETSNIWKTATKNISAYNLISNPYSSFINSADFLIENNGVGKSLKTQTLWVWNTSLNGGLGDYETRITLNDFKIAPGQAFFIEVDNNLGVNFQKESQVHESGDTFLKTSKSKIKLSITEGTNSKSTEIYFIEGASKGFDNGYDGEIFGGINTDFNIYTYLVSGDTSKKLSIQSLPNTNFEDLVIPLGIKVNTGKEINFSLSTKNIPSGLHFYLEDKKNKTLTKLDNNTSTYKVLFTDEMKETGNFFLHTKSKVLSTETTISSNVKVYNVGNQLLINGITNKNIELNLFTVLGKKVLKKSFSSNGNSSIEIPKLPAGIYLVKLKNDNTDITKKIILE